MVDDQTTKLGGQIGAGLRFNSNFALNAGYYVTNAKLRSIDSTFGIGGEYQVSGLNSNLIYVF